MDANILDELKSLFAGKPGSCSIAFDLISPEGAVATLQADQRVRADQDLVKPFASCAEKTPSNWRPAVSVATFLFRKLTQRTQRKATEATEVPIEMGKIRLKVGFLCISL